MIRTLLIMIAMTAIARADPDLKVHHAPMPRHLRMRTAQHAAGPPAAPADADDTSNAIPAPLRARTERAAELGIAPTDPAAAVRFRMDLGFGVDGAQAAATPNQAGHTLSETPGYDSSRGYGFGDLYLGTHGLVLPSLSTYVAAHAQLYADSAFPPLPTPYDRADQLQIRSGWAETDGLFEQKYLQPIRVRAGRQYIYGPAPAHIDGLDAGYETKILRIHFFGGTRVPDWDLTQGSRDSITGADLRLDLAAWKHFPAVLDASTFHWGDHDHSEIGASVTRGKGLYLRGSARSLDGHLAHENLTAHFRVSDVTRITAELDHRSSYDWRWDPEWVTSSDTDAARRYLDLGVVSPRLLASVRAGTVLVDNVDVLLRGGAAFDQLPSGDPTDSSFAATWGEVGGALEVRLRRTLAFGASTTFRTYRRLEIAQPGEPLPLTGTMTFPATGLALPPAAAQGEQSFLEGGLSARYSTGARRLSAEVELYARRIRWHTLYDVLVFGAPSDPSPYIEKAPLADTRGGGRFSLEAWVTPRVRLRAEYELSTGLELAPEILGFKSLRLLAEGTL